MPETENRIEQFGTRPPRRSALAAVITEMPRGRFAAQVDEKLMEAVQAAEEIGGVAEVTIKLKIKRMQHGEMQVGGSVSNKLPTVAEPPAVFFVDEQTHQLVRDDPRQKTLTLERVDREESGQPA